MEACDELLFTGCQDNPRTRLNRPPPYTQPMEISPRAATKVETKEVPKEAVDTGPDDMPPLQDISDSDEESMTSSFNKSRLSADSSTSSTDVEESYSDGEESQMSEVTPEEEKILEENPVYSVQELANIEAVAGPLVRDAVARASGPFYQPDTLCGMASNAVMIFYPGQGPTLISQRSVERPTRALVTFGPIDEAVSLTYDSAEDNLSQDRNSLDNSPCHGGRRSHSGNTPRGSPARKFRRPRPTSKE